MVVKYICPFCYKYMPDGYQRSGWSCCGEVGHATILPECPKCGAESLELPLNACPVCGWKSEISTPRTDAVDAVADQNYGVDLYRNMLEHARQLERELNAALIAAGVASLERGEWAAERAALLGRLGESDHGR